MSNQSGDDSLEPLKRQLLDELREALRKDDVREVRAVVGDLVTATELFARHDTESGELDRPSAGGEEVAGRPERKFRGGTGEWYEETLRTAKNAVEALVEGGGSFREGDLVKTAGAQVRVDRPEEAVDSAVSEFLDELLASGALEESSNGWISAGSTAEVRAALSEVVEKLVEERRSESDGNSR